MWATRTYGNPAIRTSFDVGSQCPDPQHWKHRCPIQTAEKPNRSIEAPIRGETNAYMSEYQEPSSDMLNAARPDIQIKSGWSKLLVARRRIPEAIFMRVATFCTIATQSSVLRSDQHWRPAGNQSDFAAGQEPKSECIRGTKGSLPQAGMPIQAHSVRAGLTVARADRVQRALSPRTKSPRERQPTVVSADSR
jgi:hypothetical protein